MKKAVFIMCFFGLSYFVQGQEQDSIIYEYARVSVISGKYRVYYQDGKKEDLKAILNLNPSPIDDEDMSVIFFKINNFLINKKYELITSAVRTGYHEYIYKRKWVVKKRVG